MVTSEYVFLTLVKGIFPVFKLLQSSPSSCRTMNVNQGTVGSDPVILATAGYDHTVRFWQAHSGICTRTVQHQDSVS